MTSVLLFIIYALLINLYISLEFLKAPVRIPVTYCVYKCFKYNRVKMKNDSLLNNELFDDIREKISLSGHLLTTTGLNSLQVLHYGALKCQIHVRTKHVHIQL